MTTTYPSLQGFIRLDLAAYPDSIHIVYVREESVPNFPSTRLVISSLWTCRNRSSAPHTTFDMYIVKIAGDTGLTCSIPLAIVIDPSIFPSTTVWDGRVAGV